MTRIWHHFTRWEDVPAGLWSRDAHAVDLDTALTFMRDVPKWGSAMRQVIREWPRSSEQNLSHGQRNRVAWLGQAAVCLATGQPAVATRQAWWRLSIEQQTQANGAAHSAITEWEMTQCPASQ